MFFVVFSLLWIMALSNTFYAESNTLIKLFEKDYPDEGHGTRADQISLAVSEHILDCCRHWQDAVSLLEKNGFSVIVIDDIDEVAELNKRYTQSKNFWKNKYDGYVYENYDIFLRARRDEKLKSVSYQINLFVKEQKVLWVTARLEKYRIFMQ